MSPTLPEPGPRNAAPLRVFFALWPDACARDALSALARDTAAQGGGRAPSAANLHLTLAFLGDVAAPRIAALHAIGPAVASAVPRFTLTLDRVGAFGDAGIAWAGTSAAPGELERLVQLLSSALAKEGFPIERRPFHPHVTLARRCRSPAGGGPAEPIAWSVERIALNASERSPSGPRYRELGAWPLESKAADVRARVDG
jgi:RNA 2',3'-cyclic 3'-phosphodiesterase